MNMHDASRTRTMKRSAAPRLENLEDRHLLSGKPAPQVTIQEIPITSGLYAGTDGLKITGTSKNDRISISDNGTGKAGNISVTLGDGLHYTPTGTVSEILVATGAGSDRVTYELDGNLQPNVNELVFVGSNLKQGGGSLQLTVNVVGKVLAGSSLGILGMPDARKTTTMSVNDSGEIDGGLNAILSPLGPTSPSGGPEVYHFSSTATIGPGAQVVTGFLGSPRSDIASVSYSGTNNGELDINEFGNGGNDQLRAEVHMSPGSTGSVGSPIKPSVLQTSGKKDQLRFTIDQGTDSTTATNIFAEVIDTSKRDTSTHTANVRAKTKGSDRIVT
jgi:hypothetical protein